MSDKIEDGGPAFPTLPLTGALGSKIQEPSSGLSMRDYFAGRALSSCYAISKMAGEDDDCIAGSCYGIADAMLSARKGAQP